jgi:hypothetical protein
VDAAFSATPDIRPVCWVRIDNLHMVASDKRRYR